MKTINSENKRILSYYKSIILFSPIISGLVIALIIRMIVIEAFGKTERLFFAIILSTLVLLLGIICFKKKEIFLFCLAMSLGFASTLVNPIEPAWSGLPIEAINRYSGYSVTDSRKLSSGKFVFEIKLCDVESKNGKFAQAGGNVVVFCQNDPKVFMGSMLTIASGLNASEEYQSVMSRQREGEYSFLKEGSNFFSYPKSDDIKKTSWKNNIYKQRSTLLKKILFRNKNLSSGSGGLFTALFIGNRDGLSLIENQVFRRSGCAHVLALSGMHLGILSGIILLLLKPIPGRKIAFSISCIIILFYLFLTGFGISLTRAALMYFFGGISYAFYRKFRPIDVLSISFCFIVISNPSSFYTLSFQLTFSAVAGILFISPIFERLLRPFLPHWLSLSLSCSLGAQLFVFPFLIHYFGEVFQIGIFSGLIIAPMVTVFIWIGILHVITGLGLLSILEGYLYKAIFFSAEKLSVFPSIGRKMTVEGAIFFCCMLIILLTGYSVYRRKVDGVPN